MLDMRDVIITGDLNFHLDIPIQLDVRRFSETLCDRGIKQLVNDSKMCPLLWVASTHSKGHILDVVILRDNTCIVPALANIYDPCLCVTRGSSSGDHLSISFDVNTRKPSGMRKTTTFRRLKQIGVSDFMTYIAFLSNLLVDGPVGAMVEAYDTGLHRIVDHNAHLIVKTVILSPDSPWNTDELPRDNHYRQRAERTRLRTGLMVLRQVYRAQCMVVNRMLLTAKRNYYSDKIASCRSNQKQLFNITKSLMGVSCHAQLPSYVSSHDLAQRFSNHVEKKLSDIRQSITHRSDDRSYATAAAFRGDTAFRGAQLTRFPGVNDSDISKLIADSPCKSCGLDPLHIWLLKLCSYDHSYNKLLPRKFNCT